MDFEDKSFSKIMKRSNLTRNYLPLPPGFCKRNKESLQWGQIILQKHPGGAAWHLTVSHDREGDGVTLTDGWLGFVRDSKVEQGEVVFFRVIQGNILSFDIYDKNGLEKEVSEVVGEGGAVEGGLVPARQSHPEPLSFKRPVSVKLEPMDPVEPPRLALCQSRFIESESEHESDSNEALSGSMSWESFTVQITMKYMMYVPTPYHLTFPSHKATVMLKDPTGREWAVSWNPSVRQLTKGLVAFARGNNLRLGDSVMFVPLQRGRFRVKKVDDYY